MASQNHQHNHYHTHQQSVNQAHNTFQANVFAGPNLSYGPPPPLHYQHAQLTSNNFPVQPPSPHGSAHPPSLLPSAMPPPPPPQPVRHTLDPNGIYDGLTYRSTLLKHNVPAAPPPEKEWSVQSEKCLAYLRSQLATLQKPNPAAAKTRSSKSKSTKHKGHPSPSNITTTSKASQPPTTTTATDDPAARTAYDIFVRHLSDLADSGSNFTRLMRRYRYERAGCGQLTLENGDVIWLADHLLYHWQIMRHSVAGMQQFLERVLAARDTVRSRDWPDREVLRVCGMKEGVKHVRQAVAYVEHYMEPYEGAMGELAGMVEFFDDGRGDDEMWKAVSREMMKANDGDVRCLPKKGQTASARAERGVQG